MRFSASIIVLATACALEAATFSSPTRLPDLGLAVPLFVGVQGAPFELPQAESWLVSGAKDGSQRLEDRYDVGDLWLARTVRARFVAPDGTLLYLARLDAKVPSEEPDARMTRTEWSRRVKPLDVKDALQRDAAVAAAAPVEVGPPARFRRANRRNLLDLWCYPTTNEAIVCAFRPRPGDTRVKTPWYLASFVAAPGASIEPLRAYVDTDFLDSIAVLAADGRPSPEPASESDRLRADYAANIANYAEWHFHSAADVVVADDLDDTSRAALVGAITNRLPRYRRVFARVAPSPLASTNVLAAVRVFRERGEYLDYVGEDRQWTAALWDPLHRELVLHLGEDGVEPLLKTVWHESFHQYLAYAGGMTKTSPWFNEGHAQLFEHTHFDMEGELVFDRDEEAARFVHANVERLAAALPALLVMDYWPRDDEPVGFYSGTVEEVQLKYRLAWSLAYFLEVGAPKVRFRPFEKVRADYVRKLVETRDGRTATFKVLDEDLRALLVAEWTAFWKRR